MRYYLCILAGLVLLTKCNVNGNQDKIGEVKVDSIFKKEDLTYDTTIHAAHIFVALCDNKYQGIVPVPAGIGNGQDPQNNLYWGALYGMKTYFNKSKEWKLIRKTKIDNTILERLVYKHISQDFYLVADAYNGKEIKKSTSDFLYSSTGQFKDTLVISGKIIGINGNAQLIGYIGHDGLMDFNINDDFKNEDNIKREVIILACYSKRFFGPLLEDANITPLVWTTHLMAPEAYILHDALTGYLQNESNTSVQNRAAKAYAKYQNCSIKAARNLFVTGW